MKAKRVSALLMGLLLIARAVPSAAAGSGTGPSVEPPQALPTFWDPEPADRLVGRIIAVMSDGELLAQTFMVGWEGDTVSTDLRRWVQERSVGGIKVFTRNVSSLPQIASTVGQAQDLAQKNRFHIPLLVATDQEGGWIRHVKFETSMTPGNLALGAAGMPRDSYLTGYYIGEELAALGINMNFAPDADVYSNPEANVIGPRSFGSDPAAVGLQAVAFVHGMEKAGVLCTAKHFPGHGDADADSHGRLPTINEDFNGIWNRELVPFRMLIKDGIRAIMSGHLSFPKVLGYEMPATLSSYFLRTLLRDSLGFRGIVITDDMEMDGVLAGGIDTPTACRKAIDAGNDMVLISHTPRTQERTWTLLMEAMRKEPAFRSTVVEAATRILTVKMSLLKEPVAAPGASAGGVAVPGAGTPAASGAGTPAASGAGTPAASGAGTPAASGAGAYRFVPLYPDDAHIFDKVPAPGAASFFLQSACRAATTLRAGRIPWNPGPGERVLLVSQYQEFLEEGRRRYPRAESLYFPLTPLYWSRPEDRAAVLAAARRSDCIVFCLANYNSLDILKRLKDLGKQIFVISALSPIYLPEVPWVETAVAVYGQNTDSFRAGLAVLSGDFQAAGKLPVFFSPAAREAQ